MAKSIHSLLNNMFEEIPFQKLDRETRARILKVLSVDVNDLGASSRTQFDDFASSVLKTIKAIRDDSDYNDHIHRLRKSLSMGEKYFKPENSIEKGIDQMDQLIKRINKRK